MHAGLARSHAHFRLDSNVAGQIRQQHVVIDRARVLLKVEHAGAAGRGGGRGRGQGDGWGSLTVS
jgi:hypothetical protein